MLAFAVCIFLGFSLTAEEDAGVGAFLIDMYSGVQRITNQQRMPHNMNMYVAQYWYGWLGVQSGLYDTLLDLESRERRILYIP